MATSTAIIATTIKSSASENPFLLFFAMHVHYYIVFFYYMASHFSYDFAS